MVIVIRDTTIVSDGTEVHADIAFADGKVAAVGRLGGLEADVRIDGRGKVVMPGLVDVGVNLCAESKRLPASDQGLASLSADAAAGGVTTMVMAAEFDPANPLAEEVARRKAADAELSRVDYSYHCFIADWNEARRRQVRALVAAGVPSVWLANTDLGAEWPGVALAQAVVRELPEGTVAIAHATDPLVENALRKGLITASQTSAKAWTNVFPEEVEACALRTLAGLTRGARARVLLLGVSNNEALQELMSVREKGSTMVAAAKISHLVQSTDQLEEDAASLIPLVWPPLRGRGEQTSLWSALEDGLLGIVTSAHRPRRLDEMKKAQADAFSTPGGSSGLGHLLPLLLSEGVTKWRLSLETLSQCAAADPAKLAGLYPRKGTLQIGADADFVVLNMTETRALEPAGEGAYFDPYAGMEATGTIESVYVRGHCVLGAAAEESPCGQFVERRVSLA